MEDTKNKVEAILFTVGRFVGLDEISRISGIASFGYLKDTIAALKKEYESRNCGLEIVEQDNKWKLSLRKNYLYLTEGLLSDSELDKPTQETLAIIAYKNPIFQSEVINIRGNKAYDHIKILKELDFITSDKSGRTRLLKITPKFFDYFDVVEDQLKAKLNSVEETKSEDLEQKNEN